MLKDNSVMISKKEKKELFQKLLKEINSIDPDLQKFNGHLASALAEKVAKEINILTPYNSLFEDAFKKKIWEYVIAYDKARKDPSNPGKLPKLIKPTHELIIKTLELYNK